jgi:hypothetical protein
VSLGRLSVNLPEVSVAAVNGPEPIFVASAEGTPPTIVNVTVAGLLPPLPFVAFPLLEFPPQPVINKNAEARIDTRTSAKDIAALPSCYHWLEALGLGGQSAALGCY